MVRRARRGFTLIELLVVIGIILLLMTIGVIGYIHIDKVGSEKSTQTRLAQCQSFQAEYEAVAQLQYVEGAGPPSSIYVAIGGGPQVMMTNPGDVTAGSTSRLAIPGMVYNTGRIVGIFAQIPKVKTELSQISPAAMLQGQTGTTWIDPTQSNSPLYVVLDAWRNPIIYVPATGLPNVTFGTGANQVVKTVVSLDGRPFWASAGQDGSFTTGDDNLYSVPVKAQ